MTERIVFLFLVEFIVFAIGFLIGSSWMWHRASVMPEIKLASRFGIALFIRPKSPSPSTTEKG